MKDEHPYFLPEFSCETKYPRIWACLRVIIITVVAILGLGLGGCRFFDEIKSNYTLSPQVSSPEIPNASMNYEPVKWPLDKSPKCDLKRNQTENSLWATNSRTFLGTLKEVKVGDVVKVRVKVTDRVALSNKTTGQQQYSKSIPGPQVFGFSLPGGKFLDIKSNNSNSGAGKIDRTENIEVTIAALATQEFPNGNLVINGSQEIRVNNELRRIKVVGVIRPSDISSDNSIDSSKIAELRVDYNGDGILTNLQKPKMGARFLDVVLPF